MCLDLDFDDLAIMTAVLHVGLGAARTDAIRLRRIVCLGPALGLWTLRPTVSGFARLLAALAAATRLGLSCLLAAATEPRLGMGCARRTELLDCCPEFLQFFRLLRNHVFQPEYLFAPPSCGFCSGVDFRRSEDRLQPHNLALKLAHVPRALTLAKFLQVCARDRKLLSVGFMYQPQPVKAAALFNCLSPQLFGKSFRFPKRLFQLYDSGFRRIGTGPLPRNRSTQVIR